MFLLDTNVLSEMRKMKSGRAAPAVAAWARATPVESLFLSSITVLEIELGILLVERRDSAQGARLRRWLHQRILPTFADRILPVDLSVALRCAALHVPNPQAERDALIAATALVHGLTVVTRNTSDFDATGVSILNPWQR
jgi:predicted nucleic acid-binding protein